MYNEASQQKWIDKRSVKPWPLRSLDLMPLDFYLRNFAKQHVYSERINDFNNLKQRIIDVIHSTTPNVLKRVREELECRLDICRATNGAQIELHWIGMKLGELPFNVEKISLFYLISLISRDWSKVHQHFTDTLYIPCASKHRVLFGIIFRAAKEKFSFE